MNTAEYTAYTQQRILQDPRYDTCNLSGQFIPHFRASYRIQVLSHGMIHSGYVGITAGWKPVFILVYNKRCRGSSVTLSDEDEIVKLYR